MPRKANNKTSYVMNLITNGEEEQGQESQGGQAMQNEPASQDSRNAQGVQAAAQASAPGASPEAEIKKVVVVDEDQESERLSEEIKSRLELQLEEELKDQAEAAEAEDMAEPQMAEPVVSQNAVQESVEAVSAAEEAGHTVPEDIAATKTEIVEPTMDTEMNTNTTTQPTQPSQSGYRMVNVMETLAARVDLDKYIEEYDVCPCPRCRADVYALILTTLPSKYVVMDEAAISPMLNFYESRRKTDIFTATLKACLEVKEHPRHEGAAEE